MTQQYRRRAGEPVDVWRVGDGEPPEWAKAWHLYEACRKHPGDTLMRYESGVIDFMLPEAFARDYEPVPADPAPAVLGTPEGNAAVIAELHDLAAQVGMVRSEEHTSELQSLMRISYAVFCLKKKKKKRTNKEKEYTPTASH